MNDTIKYFTSTNSSSSEPSKLYIGIARIISALPGIFINILFITTISRNGQLRKNLILLSLLAFGDLLCSMHVLAHGIFNVIDNEKAFNLTGSHCFKAPHLPLMIWCSHMESIATLFVAIERAIAIWFPYQYAKYRKDSYITGACVLCISFTTASFIVSIIIAVQRHSTIPGCFAPTAVSEAYGGFIYSLTSVLGTISLMVYIAVFISIKCSHCMTNNYHPGFAETQQKRQIWLLKISSILAFSTFVFIVIPYTILALGHNDRTKTSFVGTVRSYYSFPMAANSFIGMALCIVASPQLRKAIKTTLFCCKLSRQNSATASTRTQVSGLSDMVIGTDNDKTSVDDHQV